MANDISLSKLLIEDLIERFESDIIFDIHSYHGRYGRSFARKELVRRGFSALKAIADHLKAHPPIDYRDLSTAWGHLVSEIELQVDQGKSGPRRMNDTAGWILWAERMTGQSTHRVLQKRPARDE